MDSVSSLIHLPFCLLCMSSQFNKGHLVPQGHFLAFPFLLKVFVLHTGSGLHGGYISFHDHNNQGSIVQIRRFCSQALFFFLEKEKIEKEKAS